MSKRPLIAILGGARETRMAVGWLAQAQAQADAVLVWARGGGDAVPLGLAEPGEVPRGARGILDVTHAFDTNTRRAAMTRAPGAVYACVQRDPWRAGPGDDWSEVDSIEQAVAALPRGARVLAATGRDSRAALARHDGQVFLRQLSRHDQPTGHDNCTYLFGAAPFDADGEAALLTRLRIDVVLARNIGGSGSFPKLAAARALGLPVVLVRPPARPAGPRLRSAGEVAQWVATL